jgi:hypothetical protein
MELTFRVVVVVVPLLLTLRARKGEQETRRMNEKIELIERSEGHFYRTPIGILPSVTTIMRLIPNPHLIAWKSRTPNWKKISSHAAYVGTKTHRTIERYLNDESLDELYCDEVSKPFAAFRDWQCTSGFTLVDCERMIWSDNGYGGTVDLVGYINGALYLIDIKTSKAVYPDYSLQIAAYRTGYEERTGEQIEGMGILRLDKPTGAFEWKEYCDAEYQSAWEEFMLLCESWHSPNNDNE